MSSDSAEDFDSCRCHHCTSPYASTESGPACNHGHALLSRALGELMTEVSITRLPCKAACAAASCQLAAQGSAMQVRIMTDIHLAHDRGDPLPSLPHGGYGASHAAMAQRAHLAQGRWEASRLVSCVCLLSMAGAAAEHARGHAGASLLHTAERMGRCPGGIHGWCSHRKRKSRKLCQPALCSSALGQGLAAGNSQDPHIFTNKGFPSTRLTPCAPDGFDSPSSPCQQHSGPIPCLHIGHCMHMHQPTMPWA